MSPAPLPPPRFLKFGVLVSAMSMFAALGVFMMSLEPQDDTIAGPRVVITDAGCEPNALDVSAGETTFTVVNRSERAIEWEILDGVMVIAERENIAPGLRQPLTARLPAGDYRMTCGLLSNPRGTLHVAAADDASPASPLSHKDFLGALAEYKVYLTLQSRRLIDAADTLHRAIEDGDLAAARDAYAQARLIDQRLAMATGLFSDLDQRLNARAEYFAQRDEDPNFIGFQRLAQGLFEASTTAGLAPVSAQLRDDVRTLAERWRHQAIPPAQLANGSARVLAAWHDHSIDQAPLDARELLDLRGLLQGADKIASLLGPLLESRDPQTLSRLTSELAALKTALPESGTAADRDALLTETRALSRTLSEINHTLALQG
ncbi:iron uptake system protein EfeO [Chromohalobacter israelensis]|uniref:iron uptake system protein EfeO n=1 Tax=Chromohalobacter israelensis TaxID=141390 RepID=UPI0015C40F15|nr:iron uptake system protein EfeO [Chromohalobacter salexigens]NWO55316.1 multidrug DMT transporter permease [Chromohalobacter salexigens]